MPIRRFTIRSTFGGRPCYHGVMDDPFAFSDEPSSAASPAEPTHRPPPAPWLEALNEAQRSAVETLDGPVLVLAGAGTGKTRVLTTRFAHLLTSGRARPWQILAVTFTNKAAREMRERVAALIDGSVDGWWVGTFHASCTRILRREAERVGLEPSFTILDSDDQLRLIKQLIEARNLDPKRNPPRAISGIIQRWKDRGLTPDRVTEAEGAAEFDGLAHALYQDYQARLLAVNACDFGDLLLHVLTLFRTEAEVLSRWQSRFRYLLIDEYQDTNVAQYLWLRALAQPHHNICCVGDDDQSIYSWRGAEVGNILRFEQDFPGATVVRLEHNYRSTPQILAAASHLIAHNEKRLGKTLFTDANAAGEPVAVRGTLDGEDEARLVVNDIERLRRTGHSLAEVAILVRAGFQTREFEERLLTVGVPYRVVGGPRFYERQEIRDAIAYLRVLVQPDDDLAFERIVNLPKRGLGAASMAAVHALARAQSLSLAVAAGRLVETEDLRPAARKNLGSLLNDFSRWRGQLAEIDHASLTGIVLDESGYTEMWRKDKSPEAPGRLENLKELVGAIAEFESLGAFLEHVSLVMDVDGNTDSDQVTLMTLHAAKGLEFDCVFLPGWEDGLFPHQRALDEGGAGGLEEERRLAYVGLTRARKRAFISYAANRNVYGSWQSTIPSRFVGELPEAAIKVSMPTGPHGTPSLSAGRGQADWDQAGSVIADAAFPLASRRAPLLSGVSYTKVTRPPPEVPFTVGQRVFHQKFGYGEVLSVDGDKLDVAFDKAGTKKIVHSFVQAA